MTKIKIPVRKEMRITNILDASAKRSNLDFKIHYSLNKNESRFNREKEIFDQMIESKKESFELIVNGEPVTEKVPTYTPQGEVMMTVKKYRDMPKMIEEVNKILDQEIEIEVWQLFFSTIKEAQEAFGSDNELLLRELVDTLVIIEEDLDSPYSKPSPKASKA